MVNLEMCGGRVEVGGALRTRMDVATESSEAQEDGIVGETLMPQPAPPPFPTVKLHQFLPILAHIKPPHLLDAGRLEPSPRN